MQTVREILFWTCIGSAILLWATAAFSLDGPLPMQPTVAEPVKADDAAKAALDKCEADRAAVEKAAQAATAIEGAIKKLAADLQKAKDDQRDAEGQLTQDRESFKTLIESRFKTPATTLTAPKEIVTAMPKAEAATDKPLIVDFLTQPGCAPCQRLEREVLPFAKAIVGEQNLRSYDLAQPWGAAAYPKYKFTPTLLLWRPDGKGGYLPVEAKTDKEAANMTLEQFKAWIGK